MSPNPDMSDSEPPAKMSDSDAPTKKRKLRNVVRANAAQIKVLRAAYGMDELYSAEELQGLSSETGLTSQWIKSWFGRCKKKERGDQPRALEVNTEPEDDAPPRKKGRPGKEPSAARIPVPPAKLSPTGNADLHPPDDFYIPPAKPANLSAHALAPTSDHSFASSLAVVQHNPLVPSVSPGRVHHGGSHVPYLVHLPEQQKFSTSSGSNQQHSTSSLHQPTFKRPMLLPRSSENINPAPQGVLDQSQPADNWGTTPTRVSTAIASERVVPSVSIPYSRNTSVAHPLATASTFPKPTSSVDLTPAYLLRTHQQHSQQAPRDELSPFRLPLRSTPAYIMQPPYGPPSSFQEPSTYTNSPVITPSALRSFMPEHDVELDDFTSTTTFDTPASDRFLFRSMLNLTPHTLADTSPTKSVLRDDDVLDMDKTPLKHLSVLHVDREGGTETALTVDEMCERLLDESLAESDPFQAAMGLVFLSKTGLKWED